MAMTPDKLLIHLLGALLLCACSPAKSEQFDLPGIALVIPDQYLDHSTMSQPHVPGFDPVRSTIWLHIPGEELRSLISARDRQALEENMLPHDVPREDVQARMPKADG